MTTVKEMTFEEKQQCAMETLKNYQLGFITPSECICQIATLPWNNFEQGHITRILEQTITINHEALKMYLQV